MRKSSPVTRAARQVARNHGRILRGRGIRGVNRLPRGQHASKAPKRIG